eukprot:TRINITY_DN571_c0_g1_i1.p1 TRINITY_DN571_c0_g1~~TRINITY_DN571_c0_g1_i1.p1  ORF type:complete len:266 (+),score=69.34 TRINITY_DN571_c0_g1_i1:25-798(+)
MPDIVEVTDDVVADVAAADGPAPAEIRGYGSVLETLKLGHQELDRILNELEQTYGSIPNAAWITVDGVAQILSRDLGYEDQDGLEASLGCSFEEFIRALPHFEVKVQDDETSVKGHLVCRMKNVVIGIPTVKTLHVKTRQDVWRTFLKGKNARVEIPELEFEIGIDSKRVVDTIYNHIARASFNLGQHMRDSRDSLSEDHLMKIGAVVIALNELLDVNEPWTFICHDPEGMSVFNPEEGVDVVVNDGSGAVESPEVA